MTPMREVRVPAEIRLDNTAMVTACGELDVATAHAFSDRLLVLVTAGCPRIVLDVSQVTFCDSRGLSALVRAANHGRACADLTVRGGRPARTTPDGSNGMTPTGTGPHGVPRFDDLGPVPPGTCDRIAAGGG